MAASKPRASRSIPSAATAINPTAKTVRLESGETLSYDKLVVAPGIDLIYSSIEGYSESAAETMPHAWKAGTQTTLLRRKLEAMPDGGLFVITAPAEPYRCPPAPYERASVVAYYLSQTKPRSKILILDAKDSFTKQALFEEAWGTRYKGLVEWVPGALGGKVVAVDATTMTITPRATSTMRTSPMSCRHRRPAASPRGRARGRHWLVPDRAGEHGVTQPARHPRARRCRDRQRDAEVRFRRQQPGQGRGDDDPQRTHRLARLPGALSQHLLELAYPGQRGEDRRQLRAGRGEDRERRVVREQGRRKP